MAETTLVPRIAEVIKEITICDFLEERYFEKSIGSGSFSSTEQDSDISYVDYYRRHVCHAGILQQTSSLISSSRREESLSNYQLFWKKYSSCCKCSRSEIVVSFLADCFSEGNEYCTIGFFRLSISAYHVHNDGKPVGQHPICSLMNGIFNNYPSKPRHLFAWNVKLVLTFIKNGWGSSQNLSDKHLTYR